MRIGNRPDTLPKLPKAANAAVKLAIAAKAAEVTRHTDVSSFEGPRSVTVRRGATASNIKQVAATVTRGVTPQSQVQPQAAPQQQNFRSSVGSFFGNLFSNVGSAVTNFVSGFSDAKVGVVKNLGESVSTFFGGLGKLLKRDFSGAFRDMGMGLVKLVQTPVDEAILIGGKLLSAVQTVIGIEPKGRALRADEIAELRKVYGDSIDYSKVVVKEGESGLLSMTGRAFVLGNTIYLPPGSVGDMETLVHEMGHIWQHQNGGTDYLSEALWGQYLGDGYDFAKGIDEGKAFSELNPEQQAQLLSTASASGFFSRPNQRFIYRGKDYTDYLNAALQQIRAGRGAP
jgi:hypothetical protein